MPTQAPPNIAISCSANDLEARLRVRHTHDPEDLTPEIVLDALEAARIEVTDAVRTCVDEFCTACRENGCVAENFLVAEGTPSIEGADGDFEPAESPDAQAAPESDTDRIDYRSFHSVHTVEAGQTIGRLIPSQPGRDGRSVFGTPIHPRRRVADVILGQNVEPSSDDPLCVVSKAAGTVVYRFGKLDVDEVVYVKHDIDYSSGNIDVPSHVSVRGSVRDLFTVKTRKSLTVGGTVEGAVVEAGEDLIVRGGIAGHQKARLTADGNVAAKFCDEARLRAGGDIMLVKEAINSQLWCMGRLVIARGDLVGGAAYACQGAELRQLGNDAGVATHLSVGTHVDLFRQAREVDQGIAQLTEAAEKIRATVGPLMANQKRLTPEQKEKATELLFQADEMETEIKRRRDAQEAALAEARPDEEPRVIVHGCVFAGATIAIEMHQTRFHRTLAGPVRIERRKTKNLTECVAVNPLSGAVTALPTTLVDLSPKADASSAPEPAERAEAPA